jgi:hypothetical protein
LKILLPVYPRFTSIENNLGNTETDSLGMEKKLKGKMRPFFLGKPRKDKVIKESPWSLIP